MRCPTLDSVYDPRRPTTFPLNPPVGVLSSGFHWWWAITHACTMRIDIHYTTSGFETFPQPAYSAAVGQALNDDHRR